MAGGLWIFLWDILCDVLGECKFGTAIDPVLADEVLSMEENVGFWPLDIVWDNRFSWSASFARLRYLVCLPCQLTPPSLSMQDKCINPPAYLHTCLAPAGANGAGRAARARRADRDAAQGAQDADGAGGASAGPAVRGEPLPVAFEVYSQSSRAGTHGTKHLPALASLVCVQGSGPASDLLASGRAVLCCALGDWTDLNLPASPSIRPPLPRIVFAPPVFASFPPPPLSLSLSLRHTHALLQVTTENTNLRRELERLEAQNNHLQVRRGAWAGFGVRAGRASASRQGPVCWQGAWRQGVPRRA